MEVLAEKIIDYASNLGATYADVRMEKRKSEYYAVDNGNLDLNLLAHNKLGMGVRVIYDGAWGFFSTTDLSINGTKKATEQAIKAAKKSSEKIKNKVVLAPIKIYQDYVKTKAIEDFWEISPEEKISYCFEIEEKLRTHQNIVSSGVELAGIGFDKLFMSTEGSKIRFENTIIFTTLKAFGIKGNVSASENKLKGGTGGFEIIKELDMFSEAEEVCKQIQDSFKAKNCPDLGRTKVLMDPVYLAILVHEILGHASEADRALDMDNAWAGSVWWAGMLGESVGSDNLSLSDDPTIEKSTAFYRYDDEGVKAEKKILIDRGVLKDHMHSRQTAVMLNSKPNAGMRAWSYEFAPLIRMSNTYFEPGDWNLEELIKETKKGVYLKNFSRTSIDDKRFNWSVSPEKAYLIEKGEIKGQVRNVRVIGDSPSFFKSIDAVSKNLALMPMPCGKGDPCQLGMNVGNGGPHIRSEARVYSMIGGA